MTRTAVFRGPVLHFVDDPDGAGEGAHAHFADGALVVRDGLVDRVGDWAAVRAGLPANATVIDCAGRLIVPGFIDTHVHYPQTDMIAS
jgi:guanine deaminase